MELSKTQALGSKADQLAQDKLKQWADMGLLVSKEHKQVEAMTRKSTFQKKGKTKQSVNKKEPEYPVQFTTKKLALQELENVRTAKKLVMKSGFVGVKNYRQAVSDAVREQPKGRRFNKLQVELMKAVLEPNGSRLVLCEGFPGTGKSTVMGKAIEIMQQQNGTHCLVLAPTGKVAASAGADTAANHTGTIDKWLIDMDAGKETIKNNSVIFIDESSMIGTVNYNRFLNHVSKAVDSGIDVKVVLIGDTNQIQSVQAGNTYTNIIKDNQHDVHYLRNIIRQKDETSLSIAKTTSLADVKAEDMAEIKKAGSHVEKSWKMLEESGRILEFDTTTEKNVAAAELYLNDPNPLREKAIFCSTNEEIKTNNEVIQDKRLAAGDIGGSSISNHEESFYVGDRVMVNKNANEYKNGDFGIISKINPDGSFEVEFGEGKGSKIKTMKDPNKISLAYAISIHKSQGLTINESLGNLSESPVADQDLWNVLNTRARYTTKILVVKSEKAKVLEAFKRENSKINLLDIGREVEAAGKAQAQTREPQQVAQVAQLDKAIEATKAATATMQAKAQAPIPTPTADPQPGRPNLMAQLKTKFRSFGKISTSVFAPRKPPVEVILQRRQAEAARQAQVLAQTQQQVKATQQVAQQQEQAKQAQIAQTQAIKKKQQLGMKL